ncbi:MAG: FAD-dependent oxidoreductase [Lachnospiraceae bacterium]|jgi:NADPH-dependent glutamate synthase beta subunit-like oxidoreductase/Pyruvate/2-oxoacid:ferredoxin oxidoreductase delta subunit|nr:FAD-dependent oxidoreductase [Lachnospiraceae bacterium]
MVEITIDGKKINVSEDQCVLEGALTNGIYIPHLCHHKDLPENGSCRMCIVSVDGSNEVTPSCKLMPKEGMVINTKSEKIDKLRFLALDLLLAGHPEDCSTCPKYGNCELQTLIQYMGGASNRMRRRSKGFKENKENPLIEHDMNRCVLCGRCVRACKNLREVNVLDYKKEDMETYIGTLHDKLLKDEGCRFCGACAEVCPTGTIRDKLMIANPDKKKEDVVLPCKAACPVHTDIPKYIRFAKAGDFDGATAVIREKIPFPTSLGYICTHVCELSCKRKELNDSMSIRNIKRYVSEHSTGKYWKEGGKQLPDTGKKVCIVGAGPAGMTAALYLRKQGHDVTVKEALSNAGGMLRYGIPKYRLPREVIDEEVKFITDKGVKLETGSKVEKPIELKNDYDAVLMAIGTHKGVRLPLEGNDLKGVLINTDFLRNVSEGKETNMGERVVVLGGGNVAFDCARSAVRLGAKKVSLACLEAREVMTADDEEIKEAQEEGIEVFPAKTFEKITGEGNVTGVDFMNVLSFEFDENRRAIITKEPNSEMHIDCDTVIFATGQRSDISPEAGLKIGRANSIDTDFETLKTSEDGIFAAGDTIYGTKSVIEAVASGRKAASLIDIYLGGDGDITEKLAPEEPEITSIGHIDGFGDLERKEPKIKSANERKDNFDKFDFGLCDSDVCGESTRCLQCDLRLNISSPRLWDEYSTKEVEV